MGVSASRKGYYWLCYMCTVIHMADTKTISLDRQAYELLRREKRKGETFSDVVKRLARPRKPLTAFAGAWKDMPHETFKMIERFRREARELDEKRWPAESGGD